MAHADLHGPLQDRYKNVTNRQRRTDKQSPLYLGFDVTPSGSAAINQISSITCIVHAVYMGGSMYSPGWISGVSLLLGIDSWC